MLSWYSLFECLNWIVAVGFTSLPVCCFILSVSLFVFVCLFVLALRKQPNGTRALVKLCGSGRSPRGAGWPMSPSLGCMKRFNTSAFLQPSPPTTTIFPLPTFLLNGQQHVTWTTWSAEAWGPPQHQLSLNILVSVCVCVLWKDEANDTERPGQVKWYCPQQSLYIATQTGPQDEYNVFWLNTETTQPRRQKESDCNRQDSSGLFQFKLPNQNKLSWSGKSVWGWKEKWKITAGLMPSDGHKQT